MDIRICIDVSDLDAAIAFYTQGIGLRLGRRLQKGWAELLGATSPIDLLCEEDGSSPLGADHPQRRSFARHWTPVHLDFAVDDLDAAVARAVAQGAKLERPIQERKWGRMANLADPWGHGFDFLQFAGRGYDEILSP
ncbi:VOC family protein [Ramlibacter sp.]|uniref:VOC family protein n=1 Tax=Ramlibacter sp. TaxID=1917967 RepID=UPI003D13DAE8